MKTLLTLVIVLAVIPSAAHAKRTEANLNGHDVVVHTSRAPVVVHRVLPPYGLHKHVYTGELKRGQVEGQNAASADARGPGQTRATPDNR